MTIEALEQLLTECGVELYDAELLTENAHHIYRVSIVTPEGVTLDKCAEVTHLLSPILDLDPPTQQSYYLEVSSPGIERVLKKPRHFIRSIGTSVTLKTKAKEQYIGELVAADGTGVTLVSDGVSHTFSYTDISKAKTYFQWS